MKKIKIILLVVFLILTSIYSASAQEGMIPISSSSEEAIQHYHEALAAMGNAEIAKSHDLLMQALEEDPDFFMVNFLLAFQNFSNQVAFNQYAADCLNTTAPLSEGEQLLKTALQRLTGNPKADVTEIGEKLVALYPKDDYAYYVLASFQTAVNDRQASISTYQRLLDVTDNPAPVYNMLGYSYLDLKDYAAAEESFDKYIALMPRHPNPYDSKGDYYMAVNDFSRAYSSFMKAHEMDESWSYEKAIKAKELLKQEEAAILNVIEEETAAYYDNDYERWAATYTQDSSTITMNGSRTGFNLLSGWDYISTYAPAILSGEKGENREIKTPIRIKIKGDVAWVVFNNKIYDDNGNLVNEFIGTNILEKDNSSWKIAYRNAVWTSSYRQADNNVINLINYAKSTGKSAEDIGRFTAEQMKASSNINLLFNQALNNWQLWSPAEDFKLIEQDENNLKFTTNNVFPELKNTPYSNNVTYEDYLTFIKVVFETIADHVGAIYTQETTPEGLLISLQKK